MMGNLMLQEDCQRSVAFMAFKEATPAYRVLRISKGFVFLLAPARSFRPITSFSDAASSPPTALYKL